MSIFWTPASSNPEESNDVGLSDQNQSRHLPVSIVPDEEIMDSVGFCSTSSGAELDVPSTCDASRGSSRVDSPGAERCFDSSRAPIKPIAATRSVPRPLCGEVETRLKAGSDKYAMNVGGNVGYGASDVMAQAPETAVLMSPGLGGGALEEVEDSGISEADWLDVTHAMLDTVHASDQACVM